MNSIATPVRPAETVADLLESLGGVPPSRVRLRPPPGEATEHDVLELHAREHKLYELVEGTLVEKAMGFREACLALALGAILREFVQPRNLGLVAGADGMMKLAEKLVRIPDVSFISWDSIPGGKVPDRPVPELRPDLAVEVLSQSNTPAEMAKKRGEYFDSGTRLVWEVDPGARTVAVYTAADTAVTLGESDTLDGGGVLPGFTLPLARLFAELDQHPGAGQ